VTANANGCATTDAIQVNYTPIPQPDLGPDRTLCEGDSLTLTVQPAAASVLWSTGSANDSLLVTASDNITVTMTLDGCVSNDAINVTFLPVVDDIDLGPDATICLGEELELDATVHNALYDWSTGDDDPSIQVTMPGTYQVVLSGPCINAADTIVITEGNCAPLVYVPNSFTPNGDGINELFAPATTGSFRYYTFLIFDRWGENIFSSDEPGEPWDGTVNGTPVQDGVYVWQLSYKAVTDEGVRQVRETGSVTLLR
jgi:gliding motility-associated-like protein